MLSKFRLVKNRRFSLIFYSLNIDNILNIIILLILAGITINTLSNSGLFEKAKEARDKWQNAQNEEEMQIARYSNEIDSYVDSNRGTVTLTEEEYEIFKNQTFFSTGNEKRIGTFINNKPLYRKTITLTIPTEFSEGFIGGLNLTDIENIQFSGYISNQENEYDQLNFNYSTSYYLFTNIQKDTNGKFNVYIKQKGYNGWNLTINVEYTKTTPTN